MPFLAKFSSKKPVSTAKPAVKTAVAPAAKTAPVQPSKARSGVIPATAPFGWRSIKNYLVKDTVRIDTVTDEAAELRRFHKLVRRVIINSYIIAALGLVLIFGMPFFEAHYRYFAMKPDRKIMELVGMSEPNMTNNALLSWATIRTTEIMTMGFGDYEKHLHAQRAFFTDEGWKSFAKAFDKAKIGEKFRNSQLVLTTVPSKAPVIIAQGKNADHVYQWIVQLPIVMTYATNNNRNIPEKSVVTLTIIRGPPDKYASGVAIKSWHD